MDHATTVGLIAANGVMLLGIIIAGARLGAFWDTPSIAMVFGGAFAALLVAYPFGVVFNVFNVVKKVFMPNVPPMAPVIKQIIEFAEVARRDGILALENKTAEIKDPFILMGVQMAIDGTDAEVMEAVLRSEMEMMSVRHKMGKALMETTARYVDRADHHARQHVKPGRDRPRYGGRAAHHALRGIPGECDVSAVG
jgi:chemotaxis protein MotA